MQVVVMKSRFTLANIWMILFFFFAFLNVLIAIFYRYHRELCLVLVSAAQPTFIIMLLKGQEMQICKVLNNYIPSGEAIFTATLPLT